MSNTTHIICFSGGHSSAIVGIEAVRKYGKENVILLNHDINPKYELQDIKEFKQSVSDYLGIPITYANINGIANPEGIPDQFDVCIEAGALTNQSGQALCTSRLKTEPFHDFLNLNFPVLDSLFEKKKPCIIYYGFDIAEKVRIQRRSGLLGAMGYRTDYILARWQNRTIYYTSQIGINPPAHYSLFEHANCIGCLKASLLHWYVVYVHYRYAYDKGILMEEAIDFTIHTVVRNGVKRPISLTELAPIYERMKKSGIEATERQSKIKFANKLRKFQLEECVTNKPCDCHD